MIMMVIASRVSREIEDEKRHDDVNDNGNQAKQLEKFVLEVEQHTHNDEGEQGEQGEPGDVSD